jgi:hypothetical protein
LVSCSDEIIQTEGVGEQSFKETPETGKRGSDRMMERNTY